MDSTKNKKTPITRRKKISTIIGAIVVVYLISLFIPYIYPYTRFPLFVVGCGKNPIIAYKFGNSYNTDNYNKYGPNFLVSEYFCTEAEAQAAGYTKSSLDDL